MERRKRDWTVIARVVSSGITGYPTSVEAFIYVPHSDILVGVSVGPEMPAGNFATTPFYDNGSSEDWPVASSEIWAERQNRNGSWIPMGEYDDGGDYAQGSRNLLPVATLTTLGDSYDLGGTASADRWRIKTTFHSSITNFGYEGVSLVIGATWDFPSTMCDAEIERLLGRCQLVGPTDPLRIVGMVLT